MEPCRGHRAPPAPLQDAGTRRAKTRRSRRATRQLFFSLFLIKYISYRCCKNYISHLRFFFFNFFFHIFWFLFFFVFFTIKIILGRQLRKAPRQKITSSQPGRAVGSCGSTGMSIPEPLPVPPPPVTTPSITRWQRGTVTAWGHPAPTPGVSGAGKGEQPPISAQLRGSYLHTYTRQTAGVGDVSKLSL